MRVLKIVVLVVLGGLVVSMGLCSAWGLVVGTTGLMSEHADESAYAPAFLLFAVPGALLTALGVWLIRRLWRSLRAPAA